MNNSEIHTVGVVGLWHLGSVYSACFAELGFQVMGFDESKTVVDNLNGAVPPVSEPGLNELLKRNIDQGRLKFTTDFSSIETCDYLIIALDTPVDKNDNLDLTLIFRLARKIAPHMQESCQVIVSSQVPVGTCSRISKILKLKYQDRIVYVPENLRLGTAIDSFFNPTRIVIGSNSKESIGSTSKLFKGVNAEIVPMNLRSAEMVKHVLNSYLAMCVSFGNEVGTLSTAMGADSLEVMNAVMKDPRVSPKAPLKPGLPFSGGTLARDLGTLRKLGKEHRRKTLVLDGVSRTNADRKKIIVQSIIKILKNRKKSKIAVLGLTYKPGTDTLRRSLALEVSQVLSKSGFLIQGYDPAVREIPRASSIKLCQSAYEALTGAALAIIFTGWKEFENLDYKRAANELEQPLIIDLPHILNKQRAEEAGLKILEV